MRLFMDHPYDASHRLEFEYILEKVLEMKEGLNLLPVQDLRVILDRTDELKRLVNAQEKRIRDYMAQRPDWR